MAGQRKLSPERKAFINNLIEHCHPEDAQNVQEMLLSHLEVYYTSNISERQLRKFKQKQKQAVVLWSDTGGQHICDALTIIETAKMQNKNVYDVVEAAFIK